jgi:hypothetical protein
MELDAEWAITSGFQLGLLFIEMRCDQKLGSSIGKFMSKAKCGWVSTSIS